MCNPIIQNDLTPHEIDETKSSYDNPLDHAQRQIGKHLDLRSPLDQEGNQQRIA